MTEGDHSVFHVSRTCALSFSPKEGGREGGRKEGRGEREGGRLIEEMKKRKWEAITSKQPL